MLLLDDGAGGAVAMYPRLRDRLAALFRADRLDSDLAAGISPDSTPARALRAQMLVCTSTRRSLAAAVMRLMSRAVDPIRAPRVAPPLCRDRVQAAMAEFAQLRRRLVAAGPVSACGVAQLSILLSRGDGPLYNRANTDDLVAAVRRASAALDPLVSG